MNIRERVKEFFGLNKSVYAMASMVVLLGMGQYMSERFLPIYLMALGGGAIAIGVLNGMTNFLGAVYSFPGGYLSDLIGYKKALVVFNVIVIFGYVIVLIFPYWQAALIGAIFFLPWSAISLPATMGLISSVFSDNKRTMGVSIHSIIRRFPMALGPILGGLLIAYLGEKNGIRATFILALILGIVSLIVQQFYIEEKKEKRSAPNPFNSIRNLNSGLRNLLVSDVLIRFCEQIPYAFVVVWCIKDVGISAVNFGLLTAIEMATALLIYVPVAYFADRTAKKPFVVFTFIFFTLFPLALLFSKSFWALVPVFVLRGLKEFGEPTRKSLILDLSPADAKASTFGAYYFIRDVIVSFAAFGGAFLWAKSPSLNLLIAFGFGVIGTIYFTVYGKDLKPVDINIGLDK